MAEDPLEALRRLGRTSGSQGWKRPAQEVLAWGTAAIGPAVLTAGLLRAGGHERDFIFLYMGLVAVLGVLRGVWPALLAAAVSFLLVDYYFVPPVGSFTIADPQDIVNLLVFLTTALVVGILASRRRRVLLETEALTCQLRETNAELVRLNKEQAEAAQAALRLARSEQQIRALQESDRLRRDLLASVSHELRTPLGTIMTESTGPALEDGEIPDARRRLMTISVEARRLKALVDDMLDMARIEGGALELHLEALTLDDAIIAAVERLHRTSPDRLVEWDQPASAVEVLADWDRLGQILDNLLANADRFGPPGTPITVLVGREEEPDLVAVHVQDEGPGVPPELRDSIFERFVQGAPQGPGSSHFHTGMGLAIVKGLVDAHAGKASLDDARKGGASFRFTLPRADHAC